jgi:hypothetical protein
MFTLFLNSSLLGGDNFQVHEFRCPEDGGEGLYVSPAYVDAIIRPTIVNVY